MSDFRQQSTLIAGNFQTHEMATVLDAVCEVCVGEYVYHFGPLDQISTEVGFPELIIICQNWPDEFSSLELNALISRFPISRFVCCYGAWCESDGRARNIFPLSIRVPARCARVRIQQEWDIVQGKAKAFPLTTGRDEIFQFEVSAKPFHLGSDGTAPVIGVRSGDRSYRVMLEEKLVSWGGQIANKSQQNEADLLIYDLDPWDLVLNQLTAQASVPPLIGMMGLAHPETITSAKLLGFETVVCKVAPEQELYQAVERILKIKAFPQAAY